MILCAGYGTRLGFLTKEIPKPMLMLNKRPLLEHLIRNLVTHGFDELLINLHYKSECIKKYFGTGSNFGAEITYTYEEKLLGTAGGPKAVEEFFTGTGSFLIHYGDIITTQDFTEMQEMHHKTDSIATLLLHRRIKSNSIVSLDKNNKIIGFLERPTEEERRGVLSPWVNSGICICKTEIFDYIPSNEECDLPRDVFSKIYLKERLTGFPLSAYRIAIDSAERLKQAEKDLSAL